MNTCSVCLTIRPSDKFWGGVSCLSAVCLPVLFILMKEVNGEQLKIEDYLHCSCVIPEKTWTLEGFVCCF